MQRPCCAPPGAAPTKHQVKAHTRNTFLKLQRDSPRDSSLVFKNPQLRGDRAVGPQLPPAKPFFGNKVRHKRVHLKPNKSHHGATPPEKKRRRPTSEARRQTQSKQGWKPREKLGPPPPHPYPTPTPASGRFQGRTSRPHLRKVPEKNPAPTPSRSQGLELRRAQAP